MAAFISPEIAANGEVAKNLPFNSDIEFWSQHDVTCRNPIFI